MIHIYISAFTHKYTTICTDIHMHIQLYDYVCIWFPGGRPHGQTRATEALTGQACTGCGPGREQERLRDTGAPERVSLSADLLDGWVGMYRPLQGIIA